MARRAQTQEPRSGLTPQVTGVIPFTSAAHEHTEPMLDETFVPGTSEVALNSPHDVPATGYLRSLWILVEGTGGALGAGVLSPDYPFNILSSIQLTDVNGAPIYGPLDGYAVMQQNIYSAANGRGVNDPRFMQDFVGTLNTVFAVRIPLEISHSDGMGSLANQNSAATYKLYLNGNTLANLFSTAPTTPPTIRVRAYVEAWTIPNEVDVLGRPQAQIPPRLGTTQYVSQFRTDVNPGFNTVRLTRVGNLLRTIIVITRAAGARDNAVFPQPVSLRWDERDIHSAVLQRYLKSLMRSTLGGDSNPADPGVFAFTFNRSNGNVVGDDSPKFWWPTVQSSRIELVGDVVTAGSWQIITTEVAPVELAPEERYELESRTGFTPEVGTPVRPGGGS